MYNLLEHAFLLKAVRCQKKKISYDGAGNYEVHPA